MTPTRLRELRHHVERHAHVTTAMASELLRHIDVQEATINLLEARLNALELKPNAAPTQESTWNRNPP